MKLTKEERFLMMLYSPGSRQGLVQALKKMRGQLAPDEIFLANLTDKVLGKLSVMSDSDFEKLDFVAGLEGEDAG